MRLLCRHFGNRVLNNLVGLVFGQRIDFPKRNRLDDQHYLNFNQQIHSSSPSVCFSQQGRGLGISPSYYERDTWLLSQEAKRKWKKKLSICPISRLLTAYTRQLEILVTTLLSHTLLTINSSVCPPNLNANTCRQCSISQLGLNVNDFISLLTANVFVIIILQISI